MIKWFQKKNWMVAFAIMGITMSIMACSSDDKEMNVPENVPEADEEILYAIGVNQGTSRGESEDNVVFTEDDILWFNVNTRELKFREMEEPLYKQLEPFHEIQINLGQNTLFVIGSFVALWDSRVFENLVLCYGKSDEDEPTLNGSYYLYDCYPLQFLDSEKVKANIEKNKEQWSIFLKHLDKKGKLKK